MKATTSTSEFPVLNLQNASTVEINIRRSLPALVNQLEATAVDLASRYGLTILRISMGIIFVWFGALKRFPAQAPPSR